MQHRIVAAAVGFVLLGVACTPREIEPAGIRVDDAELCQRDGTLHAIYSVGTCTPVVEASCTIVDGDPPAVGVEIEVDGTPYDCSPTNEQHEVECGPVPSFPFVYRNAEVQTVPICFGS